MDSFLKPVILAVLWLVFAARPAFAETMAWAQETVAQMPPAE